MTDRLSFIVEAVREIDEAVERLADMLAHADRWGPEFLAVGRQQKSGADGILARPVREGRMIYTRATVVCDVCKRQSEVVLRTRSVSGGMMGIGDLHFDMLTRGGETWQTGGVIFADSILCSTECAVEWGAASGMARGLPEQVETTPWLPASMRWAT